MKKSLLLSLMATASMSALAVQPVVENGESQSVNSAILEKSATVSSAGEMHKAVAGVSNKKIVTKAEEELAAPFYNLPGGVFSEAFMEGEGLRYYPYSSNSGSYEHVVSVPAYVNIDWKYTPLTDKVAPTDSILWQYKSIEGTSIITNTVTKANSITTPAIPYGLGIWSNPIMATGTTEANQKAFRFNAGQISYARTQLNFSDAPSKRNGFVRYNIGAWANRDSCADAVTDSLGVAAYFNFSTGDVKNIGFYLPKPASMYGMYGVMFTGITNAAYQSEKFEFSVYKVEKRDGKKLRNGGIGYEYTLGDKIGGGYLPKESIPYKVNTWQNLFIPVIEQVGEFEADSYLNIDSDVVIMFEGYTCTRVGNTYTGDLVRPGMLLAYNPYLETEAVMNYGTDGYLSTNWIYFGGNNDAPWIPVHNMSGINLALGTLAAYDEEDYYEFKAANAGETKTFEFEPTLDLNSESGYAIIDGEGAFDWYEYTVGDLDENTGLQTVTVKVNALPAGVTGRSSDLLVKIPGAEQVIKITQGEVSGIDSVVSDAAVVSSSYFDLMGRELNAEPETGMYIRQDLKADGTKVATKVVK